MDYQPSRRKEARGGGYGKFLRERGRERKLRRRQSRELQGEHRQLSGQEAAEVTLRRLHTLGSQKFGASPFSGYFERWLLNVEAVLTEFTAHPDVGSDVQLKKDTEEALSTVKRQLQDRKRIEDLATVDAEDLAKVRLRLQKTDEEFAVKAAALKMRKRRELKRLNSAVEQLKLEQTQVIKMKTGLLHLTSKRKREQKEAEAVERLNAKQTELELAMLDFNAEQRDLKAAYDAKREPLQKEIRSLQKTIGLSETDGSLEERWFCCQALSDAVNSYLQRKTQSPPASGI